jgi:hypothetical protein
MKESRRRGGGTENRKDSSPSLSLCSCLCLSAAEKPAFHARRLLCVYAIVSYDTETLIISCTGLLQQWQTFRRGKSAVGGPVDSAETITIRATEHGLITTHLNTT